MTRHSVQLPDELYERIEHLTSQTGTSADEFILAAVEEYLEDQEDIREADEIMRRRNAGDVEGTMTLDQLRRHLGLAD